MLDNLLTVRGKVGSSYDDFLIASNSVAIKSNGNNYVSEPVQRDGYYLIIPKLETGTMWGTSWQSVSTHDSIWGRVIQHAAPDYETFIDIVNKKMYVSLRIAAVVGQSSYISRDRNGYVSSPYGSWPTSIRSLEMIYYSTTLRQMMVIYPYSGGKAVPWTGYK